MLASILATACCLITPALTPHHIDIASSARAEEKPLKALSAWLKQYRSGKIKIYSTEYLNRVPLQIDWKHETITAKESFAVKYGLAPKGGLGDSTWIGDLKLIAEAVAQLDNAEAAAALVELAAVGLDGDEYAREQAPHIVRAVGEEWASRLASKEAREEVARAARGEVRIERARAVALQGAAMRCLGAFADPQFRTTIEPVLGHGDAMLRFHAAEALARLGDETATLALIAALEREESDIALPAIVEALRSLYAKYLPRLAREADKPKDGEQKDGEQKDGQPKSAEPAKKPAAAPESTRLAVRAALVALGRSTWRADMAILRLLDDFRAKETIPALITMLERFRDNPEQVQSGKLSGLVQHRAHELLVTMTGAVYPANQPDKWRTFWDTEKDKIEVAQPHAAKSGVATTVASGFCGIPVEGSRVIFILDLSRSMTFAMGNGGGTSASNDKTDRSSARIDYARRELNAAMDSMAENAQFNLITFDGNTKAKLWNKNLVPATERNRERFKKYVAEMKPDGGTNLWSALEEALKVKSLVYGDRYETNVDEIFILSDGAPSVGEVLDPIEMLRLVKESNRFSKMRINTVFISSSTAEERQNPAPWMTVKPEELMRRLAEENGGKFVNL